MCSPGYALASRATTFMNESENTCRGRNLLISPSMRFGVTRALPESPPGCRALVTGYNTHVRVRTGTDRQGSVKAKGANPGSATWSVAVCVAPARILIQKSLLLGEMG